MVFIGKAQECDLKAILELQYLAYQSEAKLFNSSDIPPLKQTIEEVYEEFKKGIILKATDETEKIIGSVRAYKENETVYIGKLMVHPSMQKKGIGTNLLSEIETALRIRSAVFAYKEMKTPRCSGSGVFDYVSDSILQK